MTSKYRTASTNKPDDYGLVLGNSSPCVMCGNDVFRVIYYADSREKLKPSDYSCTSTTRKRNFDLVICGNCSLVMIDQRPDGETLFEMAQEYVDHTYLKNTKARYRTYKKSLEKLDKVYPPEKGTTYLDLSCYYGLFVDTLIRCGRKASGIDICSNIVEEGNRRIGARHLYSARVADWSSKFLQKQFDIVTSWDAIEHVDDPLLYLSISNKLLKDDGLLVLSTMNYDSKIARQMGKHWPWLMPMHLFYFTPKTIESALKKTGYEIIKIDTYSHVVTLGYLLYKLNRSLFSTIMYKFPFNNIFLNVDLRDFMTIYATKIH